MLRGAHNRSLRRGATSSASVAAPQKCATLIPIRKKASLRFCRCCAGRSIDADRGLFSFIVGGRSAVPRHSQLAARVRRRGRRQEASSARAKGEDVGGGGGAVADDVRVARRALGFANPRDDCVAAITTPVPARSCRVGSSSPPKRLERQGERRAPRSMMCDAAPKNLGSMPPWFPTVWPSSRHRARSALCCHVRTLRHRVSASSKRFTGSREKRECCRKAAGLISWETAAASLSAPPRWSAVHYGAYVAYGAVEQGVSGKGYGGHACARRLHSHRW